MQTIAKMLFITLATALLPRDVDPWYQRSDNLAKYITWSNWAVVDQGHHITDPSSPRVAQVFPDGLVKMLHVIEYADRRFGGYIDVHSLDKPVNADPLRLSMSEFSAVTTTYMDLSNLQILQNPETESDQISFEVATNHVRKITTAAWDFALIMHNHGQRMPRYIFLVPPGLLRGSRTVVHSAGVILVRYDGRVRCKWDLSSDELATLRLPVLGLPDGP